MRHESLALTLAAGALAFGGIAAAFTPVHIVGPVAVDARAADTTATQDFALNEADGARRFDASLAMVGPNSYPMRYASGSTYTARIDRPNSYDVPFNAGYDTARQHEDAASDLLDAAMADDHAPDDGDGAEAPVSPDDVGDVVASDNVISPS